MHTKSMLVGLLCVLIGWYAAAQEKAPEPQEGQPAKEAPEEQKIELKSGLKKGQEFTCTVSSSMDLIDGGKGMKADLKFDVEGKIKELTENGTAKIKAQAKGTISIKTRPHPQESLARKIEKTEFNTEVTNRWGFRAVEEETFLCPGFEPLKDILPEKPIKIGDKWNANLTRMFMTFVFSVVAVRTSPDESVPDAKEMQKAAVRQMIQMIESMKGTTILTLAEVKDDLAIIKGKVKDVVIEQVVPFDIKKGEVVIKFDLKAGVVSLFESKLHIVAPEGEGGADILFRQEIKLKEPRKKLKYSDEELKDICVKSDVVAAVEVVVLEKREKLSYYVVKVLSELKGSSGKEHLDVLASDSMEFDKGDKHILFLTKTEESGRKMYRLTDLEKGVAEHDVKLIERIAAAAKDE